MSWFAFDRMGATIQRPDDATMRSLLGSVSAGDPEHPDVSLNYEDGWALSYNASGTLIFENVETGDGPWHMRGVTPERAPELWQRLAHGDIEAIQPKAWVSGYGSDD